MDQCSDGSEECFLDWNILPDLSAVFTAGCKSTQVCNLLSNAFGKRRTQRSVGCSQCCNSPTNGTQVPCNGYLCKQAPVARKTCGVCDKVGNPKDCAVDQECNPSEVCKINTLFIGGVIAYGLGCEQKSVCDKLLKEYKATHTRPSTGKRTEYGYLVICSACCDYHNCNKDVCNNVIKNQTCFDTTICG